MAGQLIAEYPHNTKRHGCLHCGAPRRPDERLYQFDQLVDEIIDLDGNTHAGSVAVVCEACIIEIATVMGCLSPDKARRLQGLVDDLNRRLTDAEAQLSTRRDLNKTLNRLTELAGDLRPTVDV